MIDCFLGHLHLVLIQSMLLPPVSFYYFPPVRQSLTLVLFLFRLVFALDVLFCVSRWRSSFCFCSARLNILSLCPLTTLRRCFAKRKSLCRLPDVLYVQEVDISEVWKLSLAFRDVWTGDRVLFAASGRPSIYSRLKGVVEEWAELMAEVEDPMY